MKVTMCSEKLMCTPYLETDAAALEDSRPKDMKSQREEKTETPFGGGGEGMESERKRKYDTKLNLGVQVVYSQEKIN